MRKTSRGGYRMAQVNVQDAVQTPFELLGRVPVILVPALFAGLVGLALGLALRRPLAISGGWALFGIVLVGGFATFLSIAWTTHLLDRHLRGEKPDLQESWVAVARRLPNLAVAIIVVTILVALGTFFFIVPGILLEAILIMTIPYVAKENATFDKALSYSFRFSFSGVNFLVLLLYIGIAFLLSLIPFVGSFLSSIFLVVWIPYLYLKYGQEERALESR